VEEDGMDVKLGRIESLLDKIASGVTRIANCLERPVREAAVAGDPMVYVADLDDLVARLRVRFDIRKLVANVGLLSHALRELGYPVTYVPKAQRTYPQPQPPTAQLPYAGAAGCRCAGQMGGRARGKYSLPRRPRPLRMRHVASYCAEG
jgi:hypothetical protein